MEPGFHLDWFGRWTYVAVLTPYYTLLGLFMWHYRILFRLETWTFYLKVACAIFLVLGLGFEWIAQMFYAWTFPGGRYLFEVEIPIFGWITGHKVPFEELLWIAVVIPLFYYLYLWATLVFFDIVYVVDEQGKFYKREERWAGFFEDTHISIRPKGKRGRENETVLHRRQPGFLACGVRRIRKRE